MKPDFRRQAALVLSLVIAVISWVMVYVLDWEDNVSLFAFFVALGLLSTGTMFFFLGLSVDESLTETEGRGY